MLASAVASGTELKWQKVPGVSRAREILVDGETWVRLRRMSMFGSRATVEAGGRSWTLKRVGWFHTRVTIRAAGESENLAVHTPNWLGSSGVLGFADGRKYRWATTKSFGREHSLGRDDGQALLRYRGGSRVTLDATDGEADVALLVAFGYYLLQLEREDTAAVSAASASAAAAG